MTRVTLLFSLAAMLLLSYMPSADAQAQLGKISYARGRKLGLRLCKSHVGMSRCVESPLKNIQDANDWCPYHVCGASFIPSRRCLRGVQQASHMCSVFNVRRYMYRCLDGHNHKIMKMPVGCTGTACKTELRVCACEKAKPRRMLYVATKRLRTRCRNGPPRSVSAKV